MNLDQLLLDADSHDAFLKQLMGSLMNATRASNVLPKGLEYQINQSYADHKQAVNTTGTHDHQIIQKLLDFCKISGVESRDLPEDFTDPVYYDRIVDAVDDLLDRADRLLTSKDQDSTFSGIVKSTVKLDKDRLVHDSTLDIEKPQRKWFIEPDNLRENPFRPHIVKKFHAKVDYKESIEYVDYNDSSSAGLNSFEEEEVINDNELVIAPNFYYQHPYEEEVLSFPFPEHAFAVSIDFFHPDENSRELCYIENEDQLRNAVSKLQLAQEIAIDLEHHSLRTFQGLTCLMQISSRQCDFLIDPFQLKNSMYLLGEIFANPSIMKVFHGSTHDLMWLQRDFSLYIVGLFDTYDAAKKLSLPAFSYSHLVSAYFHQSLNKTYQLADWRQRPLSEEMLRYARYDTMYLLTVYDYMRRDLRNKFGPSGIEEVLAKGRRRCLVRYEKPFFRPLGYKKAYQTFLQSKGKKEAEPSYLQDLVLAKLYDWRDSVARKEDESVPYIMSNSELMQLIYTLPDNIEGNKLQTFVQQWISSFPTSKYTKAHVEDITVVIKDTVESQLGGKNIQIEPNKPRKRVGGTELQKETKRVANTVFTFTPQYIAGLENHPVSDSIRSMESTVMNIDELFYAAEWHSPTPYNKDKDQGRLSPLVFDAIKPEGVSEENRMRIAKILNDPSRFIDPSLLTLLQSPTTVTEQSIKAASISVHASSSLPSAPALTLPFNSQVEDEEEDIIDDIPKSFEEVYHLSSKSRNKLKQKKTSQSSEQGEEKSNLGKGFDFPAYFNSQEQEGSMGDKYKDTNVDSTLGYVKEIGWVQSEEEANRLKEEAAQDEHSQSSQDLRSSGNSVQSNSSNAMRRSYEKHSSHSHPASQKLYASHDQGRGGGGGVKQNSPNSSMASFDYSKVSSAHQYIGALPSQATSNNNTQRGGRGGGGRGGGKNKGNNLSAPYFPNTFSATKK